MPAFSPCMLLRASQDMPRFLGTAGDLSHYIVEVEMLCKSCQRSSEAELIKYTTYFVEESSWDSFVLARDALEDPTSWEEFKSALYNIYPQHECCAPIAPRQALLQTPAAKPQPSSVALLPVDAMTQVAFIPVTVPAIESPAIIAFGPSALQALFTSHITALSAAPAMLLPPTLVAPP